MTITAIGQFRVVPAPYEQGFRRLGRSAAVCRFSFLMQSNPDGSSFDKVSAPSVNCTYRHGGRGDPRANRLGEVGLKVFPRHR